MIRHTKIICTIGPSCNTLEKVLQLLDTGMNVARLNFSHGTHEDHQRVIDILKEARKLSGKPLAILLDTKGPEIRVGKIENGQMTLLKGQKLKVHKNPILGCNLEVSITPSIVFDSAQKGMTVLFDNGFITSKVVDIVDEGMIVEIENDGILKSNKGVNIPNKSINLPAMTEKDVEDIVFGCRNDIDIIAASFVRSVDHVLAIKRLLIKEGKPDTLVLAKIENFQGVENFESIVQVADGIMVARGDLGVELPVYQVPRLQKMMIHKCCLGGKPVVTATQMLESMMNNPRPTRSDVSDIANAIYDSTSLVMLSGETAVGNYPIETLKVMNSVIKEAESDFNYRDFFYHDVKRVYNDVASSVTLASVKTGYSADAKAIFAFTSSGLTARLLSRLRPKMPIIVMTTKEKIYHQLAFQWGVIPFFAESAKDFDDAFQKLTDFALEKGYVKYGDLVVVTAGSSFGVAGTTNMMIVKSIGAVLVRGHRGYGSIVHGTVAIVLSSDLKKDYEVKDRFIVINRCDDSYLPLLKQARGIILQNSPDDVDSEHYVLLVAKTLDLSVIVQADIAFHSLKEGQLVTLDPQNSIVYNGIVENL